MERARHPPKAGNQARQICRQANLSEKRRARFGQLRCPRLARPAESSANHAKRTARTDIRLSATLTRIQPLYNRFSNPTPTIFQPPSNHHSSVSQQLFVRHPPRRLSATGLQPPDNYFPSTLQPSPICRVPPAPLNRPQITRTTSDGHSHAAPVGAQLPWTT